MDLKFFIIVVLLLTSAACAKETKTTPPVSEPVATPTAATDSQTNCPKGYHWVFDDNRPQPWYCAPDRKK